MSNVSFDDFVSEVRPEVLKCPDPLIIREIRKGCRDLAQDAYVWEYTHDPIYVRANVAEYDLDPPSCADIIQVIWAQHDTNILVPTSVAELDEWNGNSDWRTQTDTQAQWYYQPTHKTIRLVYTPSVSLAQGLNLIVLLKPTRDADEVDEIFYDEYLEAIGSYAKWKLMIMPGKPWTNPDLAEYHRQQWYTGKNRARLRQNRSFVPIPVWTQTPDFINP
jgi:hypothetical protein